MSNAFLAHLADYAAGHEPDPAINREDWLGNALAVFRDAFDRIGHRLPDQIRVSCGFPKGRAKAIGQVWSKTASKDGHFEIFISPEIAEALRALDILLHEICHIAAGLEHGHKGPFKRVAQMVGLAGKMTATVAGDELAQALTVGVVPNLGAYPHAELSGLHSGKKKQTTRLIKIECPNCGKKHRAAREAIESSPTACLCELTRRGWFTIDDLTPAERKETVTMEELFSWLMTPPEDTGDPDAGGE